MLAEDLEVGTVFRENGSRYTNLVILDGVTRKVLRLNSSRPLHCTISSYRLNSFNPSEVLGKLEIPNDS